MEFQNFWFLFLFLFGIEAKTQTGLSREACPTHRQWERRASCRNMAIGQSWASTLRCELHNPPLLRLLVEQNK